MHTHIGALMFIVTGIMVFIWSVLFKIAGVYLSKFHNKTVEEVGNVLFGFA